MESDFHHEIGIKFIALHVHSVRGHITLQNSQISEIKGVHISRSCFLVFLPIYACCKPRESVVARLGAVGDMLSVDKKSTTT